MNTGEIKDGSKVDFREQPEPVKEAWSTLLQYNIPVYMPVNLDRYYTAADVPQLKYVILYPVFI